MKTILLLIVSTVLFSHDLALADAAGDSQTAPDNPLVAGRADILLIASDELAQAWRPFAEWKTKTGRPTKIVSVSQIEAQYAGQDVQAKMRACCLDHIENQQTRWVILGGDSQPDRGHLPDRDTHHAGFGYDDIPTDSYYISRQDWDANGDGVYGKFDDDRQAIEYTHPQASIGRIPLRTADDVLAYTRKVVEYESSYPTDGFSSKMVFTCPEAGAYPKLQTSMKILRNDWQAGAVDSFFANQTPWDNAEAGDHQLSNDNWASMINNRQASKMHMHGHGFLPLWVLENHSRVTAKTIKTLTNASAYPVMTTVSCFTGQYDSKNDPSITESILRQPGGGAISIIAPAREGVPVFHNASDFRLMMTEGKMDGTTELLTRFWQHALAGPTSIGESFNAAKQEMTVHAKKSPGYHFVLSELNLLGDPSLDTRAAAVESLEPSIRIAQGQLTVDGIAGCSLCAWNKRGHYQTIAANEQGAAQLTLPTEHAYPLQLAVYGPSRNSRLFEATSAEEIQPIDAAAVGQL